jgi:hypothetical protein
VALPDEDSIIAVLNDQWATVVQIRSRMGRGTGSHKIAHALAQMAIVGKIEKKLEKTIAPKRNTKPMLLSFYRRRTTLT